MTVAPASKLFGVVVAAVVFVYPLIVYFFLDRYGVTLLAGLLAALLLIRVIPIVRRRSGLLLITFAAVGLFLLLIYRFESERLLMLYPTLVSLVMLGVFATTLLYPPSMIERISRMMQMEIAPPAIAYMKVLTAVWCLFFAINALISALLAWSGSMSSWALYNGLISYLITGVLIISELLYRRVYKRRHGLR